MKQYFENLGKVLFIGMSLVFMACSDSSDTDSGDGLQPNFPTEKLTPTISAGETYTLSIEPNMDWSVSIDRQVAGQWFWLNDGGNTTYEIRGKAGKFDIEVCVSDQEEYDNSRSIDVTLSMGGQSQVIATITRGVLVRYFNLSACDVDENLDFVFSDDPEGSTTFKYSEVLDPAQGRIEMLWPETMQGFRRPIKIEANFDWRLSSKPEWISNLSPSSGKAGSVVEIQLVGDPTKYPLEDSQETIVFCDAANSEQTYTYPIYIDGCADRFTFSIDKGTAFTFNAKGEYAQDASGMITWNETGVSVTVTGIAGYKLFALNQNNGSYDSEATWVSWTSEEGDNASVNVLKPTIYAITVAVNPTAEARSAGIVALPADLAAQVNTASDLLGGGTLKSEYEDYVIATLNQDGSTGYVSAQDVANLAKNGARFLPLDNSHWSVTQFGNSAAPNNYQLTCNRTDSWSEIGLIFTGDYQAPKRQGTGTSGSVEVEYIDYEVFGFDGPSEPLNTSDCWLTVHANTMDNTLKSFNIEMKPDQYSRTEKESFIMIKDANGDRVAMIYCVYNPDEQIGGTDQVNVDFAYPQHAEAMDGSKLEQLTSGSIYEQYAHYGVPVYHLTFTKENPSMSMLAGLNPYQASISTENLKWLRYESGEESQIVTMKADNGSETLQPGESRQGEILFYKDAAQSEMALVLVCTLSL